MVIKKLVNISSLKYKGIYASTVTQSEVVTMTNVMTERVQKVIDEVRPNLQADGGDIELIDVEDGIVKVQLKGACAGCPMSTMTIKWGVENLLKKKIPEVVRVETV